MPDEIDYASDLELRNTEIAIANRPRSTMTFTGHCHFSECGGVISRGLFCSSDCRDDYQIEQRKTAQQRFNLTRG